MPRKFTGLKPSDEVALAADIASINADFSAAHTLSWGVNIWAKFLALKKDRSIVVVEANGAAGSAQNVVGVQLLSAGGGDMEYAYVSMGGRMRRLLVTSLMSTGAYRYDGFCSGLLLLNADATVTEAGYSNLCLDGATRILMADGAEKRLDAIRAGECVRAVDPATGKPAADVVTFSDADEEKFGDTLDVWRFDDGAEVRTIHPHEFYCVERGRVDYLHNWRLGEHALRRDGRAVALVSHESRAGRFRHFTLTTTRHNYFANGLLAGDRHCTLSLMEARS